MITSHSFSDVMSIDDQTMTLEETKIVNEELLSDFSTKQNENETTIDTHQKQTMTGIDFDLIPDYLCQTNQSFKRKVHSILPSTMNLEDLRAIAILIHKIFSIEIIYSLWIVYRKSGMGELQSTFQTNQIGTKVWPKDVRSRIKTSQIQYIDDDDDACLTLVNSCLHDLNTKNNQYRRELIVKTSRLPGYNRSIEHIIEKFVQQRLHSLRIEIDQEIALVQYYYTDQILKRTYLDQKPNENQMEIMERLCKLKCDQDMTKYEVILLKEKISIHLASHPFERESIAQSPLINSIRDTKVREQVYKQYKNTAEQARIKMMTIYMECAEGQKQQCQTQYDIEMKEAYKIQRDLPSDQQLTKLMWNLIEQRLTNISARIECIYKFKTRLFHLQSTIH
ncbi:unnamed protein product [Adineta steineri]|uniref:Uncharacterized protein n=1 Tax=Adineta steineri TaxID=433720 RepID=A0A815GY61_9BILA|nr:unnamed protein product [Adineta steineri]CAF1594492.1 unnamed protein product [Adineta steineri]